MSRQRQSPEPESRPEPARTACLLQSGLIKQSAIAAITMELDNAAITRLVTEWSTGDTEARDALFPIIYDRIRQLARSQFSQAPKQSTLQPTALVKEAFIKLDQSGWQVESQRHFFALVARVMRQMLVDLNHPRIAAMVNGGTTDDGQPYLVMEFIDGQPIDEWCRQQQLPVSERVELLIQVCEAVHFAHQQLVVHRDLKPANVLVAADGKPKLLDFGIAKLLPMSTNDATAEPVTQHRFYTPHY